MRTSARHDRRDVIPNPGHLFLKKAREFGAATYDGLGMLVCQGAIGFTLWTGLEAPAQVMRQALEAENRPDP